jgi:hypothetical protein
VWLFLAVKRKGGAAADFGSSCCCKKPKTGKKKRCELRSWGCGSIKQSSGGAPCRWLLGKILFQEEGNVLLACCGRENHEREQLLALIWVEFD